MSNQSFAEAENVEFQKLLIYLRLQVARDLIGRDSLKDKTMSFAEVMRNKLKDKLRVSPLFDCFKSDTLTFLQSPWKTRNHQRCVDIYKSDCIFGDHMFFYRYKLDTLGSLAGLP